MNETFHIYSLATGQFTGQSITCPPDHLACNLPPECGAVIGVADWQAQCVDLGTGLVVAYQPVSPANDELQTWAWDTAAQRWLATPTLAALKLKRMAEVQSAIEAREVQQARPVRELLDALLGGDAAPATSRAAFEAVRAAIAGLQAARSAMAAASTETELNAITWTP